MFFMTRKRFEDEVCKRVEDWQKQRMFERDLCEFNTRLYKEGCDGEQIMVDALALIQQLEVDNSQLRNYIRLLQAERDAAVLDVEGWGQNCETCKYLDNSYGEDPCPTVEELEKRDGYCPRWQWRGVQKEE